MSESCTLVIKRRIEAGARRGTGGLYSKKRKIPKSRKRASKENFLTRRSKHDRVSGRKALQEDLENLGFILSLAKLEMGAEIGRRRAHLYDESGRLVGKVDTPQKREEG